MAQDFGHVVQTGFGLPEATAPWFSALVQRNGWNTYLALDGGRPVGACAMFIKDGWAWLGVDATLADARGRGAQTDLIAQRLEDGLLRGVVGFTAETGYPPAGQETTYQSHRNYLKADFALAYVRPNYIAVMPSCSTVALASDDRMNAKISRQYCREQMTEAGI
jgi:hypothetical protein